MRRAAYAGASVAAATAVILRAFHERPNFYSATVYLGQSTACRMILMNMLLLTLGTSMYGLQRLLYGPLRAIEIEQLWDKAWYAITETALAMTTFRDEVGGYFFLMFMTLLAGKVWGWIGEGRVETLEQQPPANPKTFYARLTTSLVLSELFDLLMFRYCLQSILGQSPPRAGMMVMFVFEFAVLGINSASTLSRYGLALWERWVIRKQTEAKIRERREEVRAERASTAASADSQDVTRMAPPTDDIEVDENEIDVPGWQEKGKWILFLDLATDFLKLLIYMAFFCILIVLAGIPIHMFRDLFITTRSFLKRINDYLKYRNATRNMDSRYADATVEELQRESTCIICREEMRPWQMPDQGPAADANPIRPNRAPPDERQRPKKLPCGHILHFGCLRSWLERQQVCPTCRRSVLMADSSGVGSNQRQQNAAQANPGNGQGLVEQQPGNQGQPGHQQQPNQQPNGNGAMPGINRMRTFNLGGIRLTLATGRGINVRDAVNQIQNQANHDQRQAATNNSNTTVQGSTSNRGESIDDVASDLSNIEQRIVREINNMGIAQQELQLVRNLQSELARLRAVRANRAPNNGNPLPQFGPSGPIPNLIRQQPLPQFMRGAPNVPLVPMGQQRVLESRTRSDVLHAGDVGLPTGMTLPEGWSLLPLQRTNFSNDAGTVIPEVLRQTPRSDTSSQRPNLQQASPSSVNIATRDNGDNPNQEHQNVSEYHHTNTTGAGSTGPPSLDQNDCSKPSAQLPVDDISDEAGTATNNRDVPRWASGQSSPQGEVNTDKGKGRAVQIEDADDED